MKGSYENSFFLTPTTDNEVLSVISLLKKSSSGYDNITSDLLKSSSYIILPSLVHIINLSFSTGIFPSELKIANVIPLFKAGNLAYFTNYRPVSLLSTLSKVFEKLFIQDYISILFYMTYHISFNLASKKPLNIHGTSSFL